MMNLINFLKINFLSNYFLINTVIIIIMDTIRMGIIMIIISELL